MEQPTLYTQSEEFTGRLFSHFNSPSESSLGGINRHMRDKKDKRQQKS